MKLTLFTLCLIISLTSFSQSTPTSQSTPPKKATIWLRPFLETGVSFIRNEQLKNSFGTNSTFNWGFGIRIGNPFKSNLFPYFQYSYSRHTSRTLLPNRHMDSVLNIRQVIVGFVFPLKRFENSMLRAKAGFVSSSILDEISKNSGNGYGIQLGMGFETKIDHNSRVYIDLSYDLNKFEVSQFRDYDLLKLSLGVIL